MFKVFTILVLLFTCIGAVDLATIPDNTWIKLDSITRVFPAEYTGSFHRRFWCTFTWDPDSQRILFYEGYGGSHNQDGNSIYANAVYSLTPADETVRFLNLSTYWDNPSYNEYVAGSGPETPHPRHTYGGFVYIPKYKCIYMAFGACAGSSNCDTRDMWKYHVPTDTWTKLDDPWPDSDLGGYDANFFHLPGSDTIWVFTQNSGTWISLHAFNLADETWSPIIDYGVRTHGSRHGAEDTLRRRVLYLTNTGYHFFDPATDSLTKFADTADGLPARAVMTYVPKHDRYFIYSSGEQEIWILNPADTSFALAENKSDPGKRIDRYIVYDPLNDVIATYNVDDEFHVFRYKPAGNSVKAAWNNSAGNWLTVTPNPFKAQVKIAGSGQRIADSKIGIAIYNIKGKMIQRLSATSYQLSAGVTWNPSGLPAGVYLIRAEMAGHTLTRRIVLQK